MTHLHKGHCLPMADLPGKIHHPEISNRFVTWVQSLEWVPKFWSRDPLQFQNTESVEAPKLGDVSKSISSDGTGVHTQLPSVLGDWWEADERIMDMVGFASITARWRDGVCGGGIFPACLRSRYFVAWGGEGGRASDRWRIRRMRQER